jgi:hypothetical protein
MSIPTDTITHTINILQGGAGDYIITTEYPTTILGISFYQGNVASDSILYCGSTLIFDNFAQSISYIQLNYPCYDTLKIVKTGNDKAMIVVNYAPYDLTKNPTSTPTIINGFTYGEVLLSFFLFLFMVAGVFSFIVRRTIRE